MSERRTAIAAETGRWLGLGSRPSRLFSGDRPRDPVSLTHQPHPGINCTVCLANS
ncbi:hypothetical protein [Geitlerinema sp. PCC 7407]|uniref:hypothetical protein n=1 Tax=Geitlerinema sp. PCC 7407 TaxID=1173025 RepID=UPI0002D5246E|nr:hypothetical protein [Geitlerinema sp. PCC 7407]